MDKTYIYGIGGASDSYKVIHYIVIPTEELSVLTLQFEIQKMTMRYGSIERVFMSEQHPGLSKMVAKSIKRTSIEDCLALVDYLERCSIEIKKF